MPKARISGGGSCSRSWKDRICPVPFHQSSSRIQVLERSRCWRDLQNVNLRVRSVRRRGGCGGDELGGEEKQPTLHNLLIFAVGPLAGSRCGGILISKRKGAEPRQETAVTLLRQGYKGKAREDNKQGGGGGVGKEGFYLLLHIAADHEGSWRGEERSSRAKFKLGAPSF